jgi:hypothetical protein
LEIQPDTRIHKTPGLGAMFARRLAFSERNRMASLLREHQAQFQALIVTSQKPTI